MKSLSGESARGAAPSPPAPDRSLPRSMRMAELARRSGLARETIHFYLREGLLPRPRKAGQTVAYYDETHLEKLRIIRRLREEKYLPIAVIRRLMSSPAASAERDIDALAEVLHIVPGLGADAGRGKARPLEASPEARRTALERGLLGARRAEHGEVRAEEREGEPAPGAESDPDERRVLAIVEDTLALGSSARSLTLDDMAACAADLTLLVAREAEIFFDAVLRSGDLGGSIAALREGRGAVARFITAYRDLMLRRIVEDLLVALESGPGVAARAVTVPLSIAKERDLGVLDRREALRAALGAGEPSRSAAALVWHLFACGAVAELASLPQEVIDAAGARAVVLVAWGAHERRIGAKITSSLQALERAVSAAPDFALGQILLGEAAVVRALRRPDAGASLLEEAVPALHRLVSADPGADADPAAQALGYFHRGRVEISLPAVLGRRRRGAEALLQALERVRGGAGGAELDAAACAWIAANSRLALGRYAMSTGDLEQARAHLEAAAVIDPDGLIGHAAREDLTSPAH